MKTNAKLEIYAAKMHRGVCKCGKRGCKEFGEFNKNNRHTVIHRADIGDILEFTCEHGHRNRIYI